MIKDTPDTQGNETLQGGRWKSAGTLAALLGSTLPALDARGEDLPPPNVAIDKPVPAVVRVEESPHTTPIVRANQVQRFSTIDELISNYTEDSRLLVHSSTPGSDRSLADYARTIPDNWSVFWIEDASDLTFTHNGQTFTGIDAVEVAIDTKVRNSDAFQGKVDERTGLRNGAYFAIVKTHGDRAMLYNGDEFYDRQVTKEDFAEGSVGDKPFAILGEDPNAYKAGTTAAIEAIDTAVENGAAWDATAPYAYGSGGAAVLGLGLGLGIAARRRRRKAAKDAFEKRLNLIEEALTDKRRDRAGAEMKGYQLFGTTIPKLSRFEGQTREEMKRITRSFAMLNALEQTASEVIAEAKKKAENEDPLGANGFIAALALLTDSKLPIDPKTALGEMISGTDLDEESFTAELEDYQEIDLTFDELVKLYNKEAKEVLERLDNVEEAMSTSLERADQLDDQLEMLLAEHTEKREGAFLFSHSALNGVIAPRIEEALGEATKLVHANPMKAKGLIDTAEQRLELVEQTIASSKAVSIAETHSAIVQERDAVEEEYATKLPWVDAELERISQAYEEYLKMLGEASLEDPSPEAPETGTDLVDLLQDIRGAHISFEKREMHAVTFSALEIELSYFRTAAGEELSIELDRVIASEDGPDELIKEGRETLNEISGLLSSGALEEASEVLADVDAMYVEASTILQNGKKILETFSAKKDALRERLRSLKGGFSQHEELLTKLGIDYHRDVLTFRNGDETFPDSNSTAADNIDEATERERVALGFIAAAEQYFEVGELFKAESDLQTAEANTDAVAHRLEEIVELDRRTRRVDTENKQEVDRLIARAEELHTLIFEAHTTPATIDAFASAQHRIDEPRTELALAKRDPYSTQKKLTEISALLEEFPKLVEKDVRDYEEAIRSSKDASDALESLKDALDQWDPALELNTQDNRYQDARDALTAQALNLWEKNQVLTGGLHRDWRELDKVFDEIFEEASAHERVVSETIEDAKEVRRSIIDAKEAIQTLESTGRDANFYPGNYYGVMINTDVGRSLLRESRRERLHGNFEEADRLADLAKEKAEKELQSFKNEVARRERQHQRELERKRQERERQRAVLSNPTITVGSSRSSQPRRSGGNSPGSARAKTGAARRVASARRVSTGAARRSF